RYPLPYETISHGDCCFSNILYDERIRLLKLIDPKGAMTADQLFSDPLYDFAKLSHSILGGYDFIINEFYHLPIGHNLSLNLTTPNLHSGIYAQSLAEALPSRGLDLARIRLCE